MKRIKISLVVLLIAAGGFSFAEIPAQLIELAKKAVDNYPKLKQGNEFIKLSEEQSSLAKAGYMPTINGDASYRYAKPTPSIGFPVNGQIENFQFFPANNYDLHVGLTQTIWDFGRTEASVKKTLAEIQTSKDNLENATQLIAAQVAQIFCEIVFLNKSVDVENAQIKLLEESEKIIQDKLKDGDALKFDLLSTQVKKSNAQNALIDLQTNLKKQYELMNMLTGNQGEGYISLSGIDPEQIPVLEVQAENNYDIIVLNDELKSSEWDIKSAKRGWLPSLAGKAQVGYQNGYVPNVNQLLFSYSAGVGLNIPIFGSERPNYRTKIAKINLQAAKYNLELQKITLDKDVQQAKDDIDANRNKLTNYVSQIEQAKEALNLANIRYRNGVITNLELLTAQTDLQDAELGQIQLQYSLTLAKMRIIQLSGKRYWEKLSN